MTPTSTGASPQAAVEPVEAVSDKGSDDGYVGDEWPETSDGSPWDGKNLLQLLHDGNSPFRKIWDVKLLLREVETITESQVVDIPEVFTGSNNYVSCPPHAPAQFWHSCRLSEFDERTPVAPLAWRSVYSWSSVFTWTNIQESPKIWTCRHRWQIADQYVQGFHLKMSDHRDVMARCANADVNMPQYDGFTIHWLRQQLELEATIYALLDGERSIPTPKLLYHRHSLKAGVQSPDLPTDISGRRLMIFEMTKGTKTDWRGLSEDQKVCSGPFLHRFLLVLTSQASFLNQAASVRVALLSLPLPQKFMDKWLLWSTFQPEGWMPKEIPIPISGSRDFCVAMFKAKIEAMIKDEGDIIGWEEDKQRVSAKMLATKQSLLRLIELILPTGEDFYRLVLQHDDFGIHNMSVFVDEDGIVHVTSVYDWETGCIVPILLSESELTIAGCDLIVDEDGLPTVHVRSECEKTEEQRRRNQTYSEAYLEIVKAKAPVLERCVQAGKDARHLWFALKRWDGDNADSFIEDLGSWAEKRLEAVTEGTPTASL